LPAGRRRLDRNRWNNSDHSPTFDGGSVMVWGFALAMVLCLVIAIVAYWKNFR